MRNRILSKLDRKISSVYRSNQILGLEPYSPSNKRIAISYITSPLTGNFSLTLPNAKNLISMIACFTELGFTVDVFEHSKSDFDQNFFSNRYQWVMGFGVAFNILSNLNKTALKILYLVEMPSWQLTFAEQEAITYASEQGIKVRKHNKRALKFYNNENFNISEAIIYMGWEAQKESLLQHVDKPMYQIDCSVRTDVLKWSNITKNDKRKFAWVGSGGGLVKGVPELINIFNNNPNLKLDIIGLPRTEKNILKLIKSPNIKNVGFLDAASQNFADLIKEKNAIISLSRSEGMQTSLVTSLAIGTHVICTVETGLPNTLENVTFIDRSAAEATILEHSNSLHHHTSDQLEYIRNRFSPESFRRNLFAIVQKLSGVTSRCN